MTGRRPLPLCALIAALATLLGSACEETVAPPGLSEVLTVAVDTTAMPLVRRVTVVMRAAGPATVTWGATGTPVLSLTADSAAFVHQFLVPRLRQGRNYIVEASAPGSTRTPVRATFATDSLPPIVRAIRINRTGTPSLPVALIEVVGATQFAGLLMIEDGEIAGWLPLVGSLFGATRRDNGEITMLDAELGLTSYRIDGTLAHRLPQPTAAAPTLYGRIHHDVIATPRNTLLFIANDTRVLGAETVVGEALWEWSPETGTVQKRWSAFDFLNWNVLRGSRSVPGNWLHGNGLSFGPRGNVLMSLRNADQVISIAPDFTTVEWSLGGTNGTLAVADSNRFWGQHYVSEPAAGRVLVFDNGFDRPGAPFSRAIEYQVSTTSNSAVKVWEYRAAPDIYAALVGSARRLPNGNTAILFGMLAGANASTGPITALEVTPAGTPVWQLTFGPELTRLYRVTPVASLEGEVPGVFRGR
ncbi:MAG: aryl-sulfate sulfotransferase [Gemmatimonadetes bacterium]|nr:aryl-sulfate sulfotransferase [Gemmatimonadota bacterium]